MDPQLYMWSPIRRRILDRHDAYVEAVQARVISQFRDIDVQAERHAEARWEALLRMPAREDVDMADLAEVAQDTGLEKYEMLSFLKREMLLGSLAGLYHIWDRSLRDFLEKEFRHWMDALRIEKYAWRSDFNGVVDCLRQFGWDIAKESFFEDLDACRLIVNVYKHGKGPALKDLAARYPRFLRYHDKPEFSFLAQHVDQEDLELSEQQFCKIARSLRAFWIGFPERLYPATIGGDP
jgi:hypothetical protein